MDREKEFMPVERAIITYELADWINSFLIAEYIIEALEDFGIPITFNNAKKVWLDVLGNSLPDSIKSSVNNLFTKE